MTREIRPLRRSRRALVGHPAVLAAALVLAVSFVASPASATPDTLRRAFSNIVGGPMDMVLSPFSGAMTLATNIRDIEDSTAVRVVYALPGFVWLTGLNFGSGGIRLVTGALEVVPGLILFPLDTYLDPLFDPVEDAGGLIDIENPIIWIDDPWVYKNPLVAPFAIRVKWGISYTRAQF